MSSPKNYTTYLLSEPIKLPFAAPYGQLSLIYNVDRCLSLTDDYDELVKDVITQVKLIEESLKAKTKEFSEKWQPYMDSLPKLDVDFTQVLDDIQQQLLIDNNPDPEIAFNKIKTIVNNTGQLISTDIVFTDEYLADRSKLEGYTQEAITKSMALRSEIQVILINYIIDSVASWPGAWGQKPKNLSQIDLCGDFITSKFVRDWIINNGSKEVSEQLKSFQLKL